MRLTLVSVGIISLLCTTAAAATAAPPTPAFPAELDQLVPELMREYGAKGVGVALIEDGKVGDTRYYGYADAEKRIPWSATTLVQPASVAKSMTAAGVMVLAQDGVISLDDPLFRRVSKWRPPPSEFSLDQVTISRVLSHTSGLSRWTTGIWTVNDRLPTLSAALSGDNPEKEPTLLVYQPGSKFSYSGAGYSLLQLLIEETTGKSFSTYMEAQVFGPMGLSSSRIGWPEGDLANEVKTYDEFGVPLASYRTVELGAGGWVTSLPDLARYTATFAQVNWGKGPLTTASIQKMMAPAPNGKVAEHVQIGQGLYIEEQPDGRKLVGHTGGNPGVGALFSIDPVSGDGIAILVNRSWGHHVFGPIACAWRNSKRASGSPAETCGRDPTGIIMNTVATKGLAAGRTQFGVLYSADPSKLDEQRTAWMVGNFIGAKRFRDAAAIVRWHPKHEVSAELQERLGDALSGLNDVSGARMAWSKALRLEPGRKSVAEKLKAAMASMPERGR